MPRPTMRRLAATVLVSAALTGGLAAGAGTAAAVPVDQLPGGSLAGGIGSSGVEVPSPLGEVIIALATKITGIAPGPLPGAE
ncbi:hypothetical protein O4215_17080 [Rhodococcus maanshanensis]|uniref:hypothetical protein n=1 Tax=Rhodococcus maanshanensis TaxID=183556 RepID=UPI0022B597E7|nr:hypothetical protein [Rhodococcus maanshanensis]MCZ4557283.1 hypothetical protein [Rhodococcus maanshanensis]